IFRGEILGVLAVFSRQPLERQEFNWLRMFADHAAVALANSRAFAEIERLRERLKLENDYLREEAKQERQFGDIIGQSAALEKVLDQITLVAPSEANVLVLGESGTGKELIARAIHERSRRADGPLVKVNCASIPRELFESEFFGHVRGAFTGAIRDRVGRFQLADGGTLFLDEVGEIPLDLQSKLLRVLQEGTFERVGEEKTRRANVRIVAATNRDLRREIEAGTFRQDLFFRLSVFPMELPPLRERREDIPLLVRHFIQQANKQSRCGNLQLTVEQMRRLQTYAWPGNIRELQNVIERALILSGCGAQALNLDLILPERAEASTRSFASAQAPSVAFVTQAEWETRERENLMAALETANWKIYGAGGAAELLGVKATTLASRLQAMGIKKIRG
ncbi:MAG TPA: sigma 54-interacting transcriptional regulator, partial [Blastocatellia bacterium]|nr:sigma 54-interacting transcriptional regulator [Blastocatellia bacterium]